MSASTAAAVSTPASDAPEQTPAQELRARIEALQQSIKAFADTQRAVLKEMVGALGDLNKQLTKLSKAKKPRKKSPPQQFKLEAKAAKSLHKLGLKGDTFTRAELMKGVSTYIRENKLQKEDDKKLWVADATLSKVFDVSKGDEKTYLSLTQLVTPLIRAATKVAAPTESA